MAVSATLVYTVTPTGPVSLAAMQVAMAAVVLPFADLVPIGVVIPPTSDVTAIAGTQVIRTIQLALNATFNIDFPNGTDQAGPFRDIYTHILARALAVVVTANPPIIA